MAKLAVCVSVMLVLLVALSESTPMKLCCTQYQEQPIPVRALRSYKIQEVNYCNLKAAIFQTVKHKLVCANPEDEWVKKAMETVPERL